MKDFYSILETDEQEKPVLLRCQLPLCEEYTSKYGHWLWIRKQDERYVVECAPEHNHDEKVVLRECVSLDSAMIWVRDNVL